MFGSTKLQKEGTDSEICELHTELPISDILFKANLLDLPAPKLSGNIGTV